MKRKRDITFKENQDTSYSDLNQAPMDTKKNSQEAPNELPTKKP